jgi:hypothetical protein
MNFEWAKWENILLFLVKIILIKQVVQNADVLVGYIYSGFNSINVAATTGEITFLPYSEAVVYTRPMNLLEQIEAYGITGWATWWKDFWTNANMSYKSPVVVWFLTQLGYSIQAQLSHQAEVREYKGKLYFGFTVRKFVAVGGAFVLGFLLGWYGSKSIPMDVLLLLEVVQAVLLIA